MKIELNGKTWEAEPGTTVAGLLSTRGVLPAAAIVALNLRVLAPANWDNTKLEEGDSVEIFSLVAGG